MWFNSPGKKRILAAQTLPHYEDYFLTLLAFIRRSLSPLSPQLCVFCRDEMFLQGWMKIIISHHISSYLISSHTRCFSPAALQPAANKLLLSGCLLALKRYQPLLFSFTFSCQHKLMMMTQTFLTDGGRPGREFD